MYGWGKLISFAQAIHSKLCLFCAFSCLTVPCLPLPLDQPALNLLDVEEAPPPRPGIEACLCTIQHVGMYVPMYVCTVRPLCQSVVSISLAELQSGFQCF